MSDKSTFDALDTAAAREKILSRIRTAQGRPAAAKDREEELSESYVSLKPPGPQPQIQGSTVAQFIAQSERLSASVDRVNTMDEVPRAAARYLNDRGLVTQAVVWKSMADLDWSGAGLAVEARAPYRDDPKPDLVGITGCFAAIAETGTLAMLSGPDTPASMALLPETHIAVVPESRILAHMEDVFALLRHERGAPPRALNFISGPSRTADIEQTLVIGAHGPYRVHLILLANS
jgi:L-lactate dehydrogenase complex protein LldG